MTFQFKSSHHVCGKTYKQGIHEVPKEILKDSYFLKLVECGAVVEPLVQPKQEALQDRSKRLHEKLLAEAEAEAPDEEEVVEDSDEMDFLEEPVKKVKKSTKKKGR